MSDGPVFAGVLYNAVVGAATGTGAFQFVGKNHRDINTILSGMLDG